MTDSRTQVPGGGADFRPGATPLLLFTDLDGTLLDHDTYDYRPALPAMQRLAELGVPLIPTTSKTLSEVTELQSRLGNPHPCIIENGGAICVPDGYFPQHSLPNARTLDDSVYRVMNLGPSYAHILKILHELRTLYGWRFSGFSDMSVGLVVETTGLRRGEAARARQRLSSEPLIWQDSETALTAFGHALTARGLTLTRGGRFWHVAGQVSKGIALRVLTDLYRSAGLEAPVTVACGDSPNDEAMLCTADIAVIIRRHDGNALAVQGQQQTLISDTPGPQGWNTLINQVLDDYLATEA